MTIRRLTILLGALVLSGVSAVAIAGPPFSTGDNPAQGCDHDGDCVSSKARDLDPAAEAATAASLGRQISQSRRRTQRSRGGEVSTESERQAPFAKGDNPAQHCRNQSSPPSGRAFGECVSDYAKGLDPAESRQQDGAAQGPPARLAPQTTPPVDTPDNPPADTPAGPPAGTPGGGQAESHRP